MERAARIRRSSAPRHSGRALGAIHMTPAIQLRVLFKMLRVGSGLALLLATSGVAILCANLALRQTVLADRCLLAFVALFFGLQACAVWKILLFPRPAQSLLRAVTCVLGFAGLAGVAFIGYGLFSSFSILRLLLLALGLPGAAIFLLYAFHREHRWSLPRLGGGSGTATAGVAWPSPTRPPVLVAAAAQSLPRPAEFSESRGVSAPSPALQRTPGSGSVSRSDASGPAPLS